jgi:hypothetical protein
LGRAGIGLIEKTSKNHIQWRNVGELMGEQQATENVSTQRDLESISQEEYALNEQIAYWKAELDVLNKDESIQEHLYVLEEEIRKIDLFSSDTLLAIKAPQGTEMNVLQPDPSDVPRYQVFMNAPAGHEIQCFLVPTLKASKQAFRADLEEKPFIARNGKRGRTPPPMPTCPSLLSPKRDLAGDDALHHHPQLPPKSPPTLNHGASPRHLTATPPQGHSPIRLICPEEEEDFWFNQPDVSMSDIFSLDHSVVDDSYMEFFANDHD